MTWFERFDKHKGRYIFLLVSSYVFINNTIIATSDWMEETRDGTPEFTLIEPFIWEYSSAIGILLLLPLLAIFWQRSPLKLSNVKSQLAKHLVASLLFSITHVSIMVLLREVAYWAMAGNYVNLHSGGRIYPLRATLAELSKRLSEKGFCRTHRSYGVNFSAIDHTSYLPSGDGEISLRNGTVVALSRRYKNEFKQRLG